jgi:AcrR family transcriptional regulator
LGIRERRDRERGELRAMIMDAARRLFAAEGYSAVSMRRIADAIEYSPAAIYVHFEDKESLIRELCAEDFGRLAAECVKLADEKDPVERIRRLGHLYIRFAVEHPNHYRLMFMTPVELPEMTGEHMQKRGVPEQDSYAFLLHSVNEAMIARRFMPKMNDPRLLAQTFWAVVHGVASLHITMGSDHWIDWAHLEDRATAAIEATLRGLERPASGKSAKCKPVKSHRKVGAK